MVAMQKGLGRGLGALFSDDLPENKEKETSLGMPISALVPNHKQPRRDFDDDALAALAESIKSQGVLQPIMVRPVADSRPPRYEIVAGERRWRASKLAGLTEVPVLVRELNDQEALAVALVENLQREDLNPMEEARGIRDLKEEFGLSQEAASRALGKSRSAIANSLRLLNLGQRAQEALRSGAISAGHARAILALENQSEQDALLDRIMGDSLTVREAEGWSASKKSGDGAAPAHPAPGKEATDEKPGGAPKKLPQSAVMYELQVRLAQNVGLPVRIQGQESRGKISISYSSKEELGVFLEKIGLTKELGSAL